MPLSVSSSRHTLARRLSPMFFGSSKRGLSSSMQPPSIKGSRGSTSG